VVAVVELHPDELKAFDATGSMSYWPYRATRPGRGSEGVGLFSRYPIVSVSTADIGSRPAIRAVLDVGGHQLEVFVVHPLPPVTQWQDGPWVSDLETIRRTASVDDQPTLILGDFNAAPWHPPFRDFLTHGFHDAHIWTGHGLSRSWPMDWSGPPFVRLDHALVRDGVIPTSVHDFTVPGSDHRGFVVNLALNK
jgi:endonuclease/exonuclease/phosphatase (EEP) superfamily protein YafD